MKKVLTSAALAISASAAFALPITPTFQITQTLPGSPTNYVVPTSGIGTNNIIGNVLALGGYSNTASAGWITTPNISVTPSNGGQIEVTYQLLGYEVGLVSTFASGSGSFSNNDASFMTGTWLGSSGPSITQMLGSAGGALSFTFTQGPVFASLFGSSQSVGNNASNNCFATVPCAGPNFIAQISSTSFGQEMIILFDDDGSNPSDNHDDMGVRISVREVPLPATLPLLALGLVGIGALARRRA